MNFSISRFWKMALFFFLLQQFSLAYGQKSAAELVAEIPPPTLPGNVKLKDGSRAVSLSGNFLYIANIWGGLQVADISDISRPVLVDFLQFKSEVSGTSLNGKRLYLANHESGVQILDISSPSHPSPLLAVKTPGIAYWVQGEYPYLYVALGRDGFCIMDVSDSGNPKTLTLELPGDWVNYLVKKDNLLYVAGKRDGLIIYDISNKEQPQKLFQFRTGFMTMMVQLEDSTAYVADGSGGLLILNVANPRFPVQVGRFTTKGFVTRVHKVGNYAYLADRDLGLAIVNVSNPARPFLEGEYLTESQCYDVFKRDIYVFLAANTSTLIMRHNNSPRLAEISDLIIKEAEPFTLALQATEPDGDPILFKAANLPPGSAFDEHTGVFTWTPTYEQSGVYPGIVFRVVEQTESRLSDADTVAITVEHVNRLPDLPALADTTIKENTTLTFTVPEGSDPDREDQGHLSYRAENLPTGAQFDAGSRTFTWTPTYDQSGVYTIDFILDDGAGGIDREPVTITVLHVDRPPVIAQVADQTVNEGDTLRIELTGTEPDREDQNRISFFVENLPEGAHFDTQTHVLTWVPNYDQSGMYSNIVAIMKAGALSDTSVFSITVNHVNRPPVLADIAAQTVDENQTLSFQISGSDPDVEDAGKLSFRAENLPEGARFDPDSLLFRWRPTFEQAGRYEGIRFVVEDPSGLSDSKTVTITVNNVNRPPRIVEVPEQKIKENEALQIQLQASDPDPEDAGKLTFAAVGLPAGAQLDASNGLFRWTPGFEQSGVYEPVFLVSDGEYRDSARATIVVEHVNRPPVLVDIPPLTVNENELLTYQITAEDPDKEDAGKLVFQIQNLPAGAAFDSTTRIFSWTPDYEQAGSYEVLVIAKDPGGLEDSKAMPITVNNVNRAPVITPVTAQTVEENTPLKLQFLASDPDREDAGKLLYSVTPLPEGAQFNPNTGLLEWTPSFEQAGVYELTVRASDPGGLISEFPLQVTVNNVNRAPVIEPIAAQTGDENQPLRIQITARDPDREDAGKVSLQLSPLPEGAQFDPASGVFQWTPNYQQAGSYTLTVTATDPAGLTSQQQIQITINNVNRPPVLAEISPQTVDENQLLTFVVSASDPDPEDQGKLQLAMSGLPEGAQFDPATGKFSWIPSFDQAGEYELQATASDPGGLQARMAITIRVNDVNRPPKIISPGDQKITVGKMLSFRVNASDPDAEDANQLVFIAESLPDGAQFDSNSGQFSWTPTETQVGSYVLTFKVRDGKGLEDSTDVKITVSAVQ